MDSRIPLEDAPMLHPEDDDHVLSITTTVPDRDTGLALARGAVECRLAACAQLDDAAIVSVYRWQGRLCEEREHRLTFKTVPAREAGLREWVLARRPYEVPQWLVVRMQASTAYAGWVRAETVDDPAP